jgi:hypothetical protein
MSKTYKDMRDFVAYKTATPTTKTKTPPQKPPKRPTTGRTKNWRSGLEWRLPADS